jgi:hypothetical protein
VGVGTLAKSAFFPAEIAFLETPRELSSVARESESFRRAGEFFPGRPAFHPGIRIRVLAACDSRIAGWALV